MRNIVYAAGRNGNTAAIEIKEYGDGYAVATMEQDRGVSPAQALRILKKQDGRHWVEVYRKLNQKYYYTFETVTP